MTLPLTEPLLFTHDHREWFAQKWATSDPSAPFVWKYRPAHPERGMPDLARYQATRAYFERSIA
jgi:hypothetical protein